MDNSKKDILVSIILPSYNCEPYLADAIESVLAQTEKDFELIVVDDCSTDGSAKLIKACASSDQRVTFSFLKSNSGGPARPRNRGLDLAKGEYIAFVDADDFWHPDKLRLQIETMREHDLDFSSTRLVSFTDADDIKFQSIIDDGSFEMVDINRLLKKNIFAASSVMFKRSKVGVIAFSEQEKHIAVEDYKTWLDIHQDSTLKSARLNASLVFYRVRAGSISRSKISMALKIYKLLGEIELNGKSLGFKRYYYFFTYLVGALKSSMYARV